jgi:lipopolysaccharide/colanic/teichoic acid biosynthesis glycosyltransferase
LLVAIIGLVITLVLFPFIAGAIYLNSPGPILYTQERSGRAGRRFKIIKFRSMVPDAEQEGEAIWATQNDDRVTGVGKFLRLTRLDELPQLINVLKGEMSIVGPRPERPEFIDHLQEEIPFYRARLSVKPGLTGWAQVQYRYGSTVQDALIKLEYDLYYIKYRSLPLDLLIILRTIRVMLTFKGT